MLKKFGGEDCKYTGMIRLTDGVRKEDGYFHVVPTDNGHGYLQMNVDGMWKTVNAEGFGKEELAVACYQLGFPRNAAHTNEAVSISTGLYKQDDYVDNVSCNADAQKLQDCTYDFNGRIWSKNAVEVQCVGKCAEAKTCKDGTKVSCFETDDGCECGVCPIKEVNFAFKASITIDQFNAQKVNMTAQMAHLLAVRRDYVKLALKGTARFRRTLNEDVSIFVTVKAQNETQATTITKKVQQEEFKTDLEDSLTHITGSKVTVAKVSRPTTTNINVETTKASEESNNSTVIIVVVVLSVLAVLGGVGVFAYYHYVIADGGFFDDKDADDIENTKDCDLRAAIESLDL